MAAGGGSWLGSQDRVTQPGDGDVGAFLEGIADQRRRDDAARVAALMADVTGQPPVLWGTSMIGFGRQRYRTADGREREWFAVGLSPRKAALTLYGLTYDDNDGAARPPRPAHHRQGLPLRQAARRRRPHGAERARRPGLPRQPHRPPGAAGVTGCGCTASRPADAASADGGVQRRRRGRASGVSMRAASRSNPARIIVP